MIKTQTARRLLAVLAVAVAAAAVLLMALLLRPSASDGHAVSTGFRFDPATGHLTWQLTARPTVLNFDVHYADGSQPVRSTFTSSRPEYFVPRVARCVEEAWFVYSGPHQSWPSSSVLASGEVEFCPAVKA